MFVILSIFAEGALPLRKNNILQSTPVPIYPEGELAVYACVKTNDVVLTVICRLKDSSTRINSLDDYALSGILVGSDETLFHSAKWRQMSDNTFAVSLFLNVTPYGFLFFDQTLLWKFEDRKSGLVVDETQIPVRLCFIPQRPDDANKGVQSEIIMHLHKVLSANCGEIGVSEGDKLQRAKCETKDNVAQIIHWMFSVISNLIYDSTNGNSSYSNMDYSARTVLLEYSQILAGSRPSCNCYDMAAFLQYQLLYSVGINVKFAFLEPFGYLRITDLIGQGQCNNPFFNNPLYSRSKVVSATDNRRSSFGNHAFVYLLEEDWAADACAGPHLGRETIQEYLDAAIDSVMPTLHPSGYPGLKSQIIPFEVSVVFGREMDISSRSEGRLSILPDFSKTAYWDANWNVRQDTFFPNYPIAKRVEWWENDDKRIEIAAWTVNDSIHGAGDLFLSLQKNHSMPEPIFSAGPEELGEISAMCLAEHYGRYIWLYMNCVFQITIIGVTDEDPYMIVKSLYDLVVKKQFLLDQRGVPSIQKINISSSHINVKDTVSINVECDSNLEAYIQGKFTGLDIIEENPFSFKYVARERSVNKLLVYVIDPVSLCAYCEEVTVTVV